MKPLQDTSIFTREESPLLYEAGRASVWENRSAMQVEYYGISHDPTLAIALLCYSRYSDKVYYQHRIHQVPVTFDYVVSGSCYFRSGKQAILAEAGDLVILPQDVDNAILYLPSNGHCERYGMIVEGQLFNTLLNVFHLDGFRCISIATTQTILACFERFKSSLKEGASQEHIAGEIYEFLCLVNKFNSNNTLPPLLAEITSYIESHLSDKININTIAEAFHISIPALNALFKKNLQRTAYQYLISLRMTRARELLTRSKNYRINEVAFLCGYEDPLYFSTEFRHFYGKSPKQYRNN